ncbi:conserved protein, unknown function, partial [Hepatocystis sp. ex Piliocolobus tephrosceles]
MVQTDRNKQEELFLDDNRHNDFIRCDMIKNMSEKGKEILRLMMKYRSNIIYDNLLQLKIYIKNVWVSMNLNCRFSIYDLLLIARSFKNSELIYDESCINRNINIEKLLLKNKNKSIIFQYSQQKIRKNVVKIFFSNTQAVCFIHQNGSIHIHGALTLKKICIMLIKVVKKLKYKTFWKYITQKNGTPITTVLQTDADMNKHKLNYETDKCIRVEDFMTSDSYTESYSNNSSLKSISEHYISEKGNYTIKENDFHESIVTQNITETTSVQCNICNKKKSHLNIKKVCFCNSKSKNENMSSQLNILNELDNLNNSNYEIKENTNNLSFTSDEYKSKSSNSSIFNEYIKKKVENKKTIIACEKLIDEIKGRLKRYEYEINKKLGTTDDEKEYYQNKDLPKWTLQNKTNKCGDECSYKYDDNCDDTYGSCNSDTNKKVNKTMILNKINNFDENNLDISSQPTEDTCNFISSKNSYLTNIDINISENEKINFNKNKDYIVYDEGRDELKNRQNDQKNSQKNSQKNDQKNSQKNDQKNSQK